uniref:ArsA family ATPase n=1 Tax=Saccharomonospora saliphila TaxID=369829 RepID=UPI00036FE684
MRILLFTGKGGVGKTTLAAASAARLSQWGRKTLVVSTDPAHSLADALGAPLDGEPREVENFLHAAQVDVRALVDDSWATLREHLRTLLAGLGVDALDAEELTVLPGVDELLALTEVQRLAETGPWENVVVDCGPTAETLRLLALPEAVSGYLRRATARTRRR